mgnify:CR=1 FL=1
MFLLGIFALIQCWILPGLLILSFYKDINIKDKLILSVPLSLVANYIIILILLVFNSFNQISIILISSISLIASFLLYKSEIFKILKVKVINIKLDFLSIISIFLFGTILYLAIKSTGKIIHPGDPYVMWNMWALDIFSGKLPSGSMDYPLAYPIMQAITYGMIGTDKIEFFAQSVQLIYPILIFFVFLRIIELTNAEKEKIKLTLIITLILILNQFRHTLFIGFVDPILVTSSVLIIYLIYFLKKFNFHINSFKFLLILGFIITSSGVTKQTGLYMSALSPFVIFLSLKFKLNLFSIKRILFLCLIIFIILSPWYIYKIFLFEKDIDSLNALNLINLYHGDLLSKIIRTSALVFGHQLIFIFVVLLAVISLRNKLSRLFIILIIFPYYLIWSFLYGNDARNFALVLPFIGYVIADSIVIIENYFKKIHIFKYSKIFFSFSLFLLIVNFANEKRNYNYMLDKNFKQSKNRTQHYDVNILLYHYKNQITDSKNFYFSKHSFIFLPGFENGIVLQCNENALKKLKYSKKKIFYLYQKTTCSKKFLESKIISNKSNIIFEKNGFILFSK